MTGILGALGGVGGFVQQGGFGQQANPQRVYDDGMRNSVEPVREITSMDVLQDLQSVRQQTAALLDMSNSLREFIMGVPASVKTDVLPSSKVGFLPYTHGELVAVYENLNAVANILTQLIGRFNGESR